MDHELAQHMMNPTNSRTEKGLKYEKWRRAVDDELNGMTEKQMARAKKANLDFWRGIKNPSTRVAHLAELETRGVTPAAVHTDTLLTQLSVMYRNDDYIGDRLMPAVPVTKRSDLYSTYPKRERFNFPDDEITTRGKANELNETRTTDNYSVRDYGYANFLDLETLQNQDAPLNEMVDLVEAINDGIAFKREGRILAIVVAAGSYAGNTAATGTPWDNATGGTIIADVKAADSGLFMGTGPTQKISFTSLETWNTAICNNPALHELFKYVSSGLRTTTQVAQFFGLDDLLVSKSRIETANIGQTAVYARAMTQDVFGILRVATRPSPRSLHFGSTFRMRTTPKTTQWEDPSIGVGGGLYARVATSEDHKIVAGDAGYLITNTIT